MKVRCESELTEADGRRLVFRAEVFDDRGKVGEGFHERFIIANERFLKKAEAKRNDT
jgi:predicted thioesterase